MDANPMPETTPVPSVSEPSLDRPYGLTGARKRGRPRKPPSKGQLQAQAYRLIGDILEQALQCQIKIDLPPTVNLAIKTAASWETTPEGKAEVKEFLKKVKGA